MTTTKVTTFFQEHLNEAADHVLTILAAFQKGFSAPDSPPSPSPSSEASSSSSSSSSPPPPLSPFHETIAGVTSEIMKQHAAATAHLSFPDQVRAFLSAVDFRNDWPWLSPLAAFHVLCFLSVLHLRSSTDALFLLSCSLCCLAFLSSSINDFLHARHGLFAAQDYFDESGLFVAVTWAAPLVLNVMLAVTMMLLESVRMMKVVARGKSRERSKKGGGGEGEGKKTEGGEKEKEKEKEEKKNK